MLADQRGIDTFPMRLICYATLTAAIAWLALSGLQEAGDRRADDRILLEMESLFLQLDGMWGGDAAPMYSALPSPGASVTVTLHLPDDTGYLAFGKYPGGGGIDVFSIQEEGTNGVAYLFTDSLGLRSWALSNGVQFGALNRQGGQYLPPVEPVVMEGGGEVVLHFIMAYDVVGREYWVLVERVQGL